ncbi:MAG TPA: choice-of-anchor D domain-containing protein, partial [bacterium]
GGSYGLGHGFNGTFDEMRLSSIDRQTWEFNIVGPRLQASSYSLAFGQVLLGESQSQDLLLSNQGDQTLAISSIQTQTASFSVSPTSAQIAMGQGQTLHVTFAPKATGANADTVKITSNDPNQGMLSIRLTGTGVNYRSKVAYALDDYTVALFHFDETSGSAAVDANGGRHNGTLADGVSQTSSGYYGGALHFNGKSGHVLIPNAEDLVFDMASKSFTIECFFRTDTVSKAVFFKDIAAGTDKSNYGFSIDNAGRIGSYGFGTASAWVADNAWHHAAFVYDAQTQYGSLFIDGSLSSQQAWTAGKTDTKNPRGLIIGAQEVATSSFANVFEGDIDELRISSVARKPWEFLLARSGIDVTLASVPSLGSNATVNITVPSDTASKTLTLYYRQGGTSTYTTVPATLIDATHYRAVIPGSSVTFKGLEFYVEKYTARERTTQPLYDPVRAPIAAAVRFASQAADITLSAKKYAMVSVPADLDKTSVRSVLSDDMGTYDPTRWRCFAFKDTSYAEFSDTLAYADSAWFNFTRGTAFWIISEQAKSFNIGAGISTALESPYRLTLRPQWNMVGSVFPFPVAWDDCALSSPSIGTLYYYDGTGYRIDWAVMDSWKGYWLYNTDTKSQTVYVPPRASTTGGVTKRGVCSDMADGEWLWRISAETDVAKDLDNYAGVRNEAKDAWDLLDRFEPPPIGEYITLYIDHRDWSEHAGSYAADIRQPGRDGYAWDFVMESSLVDQTISLHWDWKQSLPEGWVAYLIDETDGKVFPLAERKSLSVSTGRKAPTVRLYKFIAGTPAFVEKASDLPLVPLEFHLYPNFPNPFNPRTTIRYSLPQTAEVKLTIYNMLGQEVKVLVNGPQKAGTHQAEWDGSDRNGIQVGSGLYLSRLESLGRTAIRKLILVK